VVSCYGGEEGSEVPVEVDLPIEEVPDEEEPTLTEEQQQELLKNIQELLGSLYGGLGDQGQQNPEDVEFTPDQEKIINEFLEKQGLKDQVEL